MWVLCVLVWYSQLATIKNTSFKVSLLTSRPCLPYSNPASVHQYNIYAENEMERSCSILILKILKTPVLLIIVSIQSIVIKYSTVALTLAILVFCRVECLEWRSSLTALTNDHAWDLSQTMILWSISKERHQRS